MKWLFRQALEDIRWLNVQWLDELQDKIIITATDWTSRTFREMTNYDVDSWKKDIFGTETAFIQSAWDAYNPIYKIGKLWEDNAIIYRETITNEYNSTLQWMLNNFQIANEWDRKLATSIWWNVRTILRQYTLTNQLVDAMDATLWINEEIVRWIKWYVLWFWGTTSFGSMWRK